MKMLKSSFRQREQWQLICPLFSPLYLSEHCFRTFIFRRGRLKLFQTTLYLYCTSSAMQSALVGGQCGLVNHLGQGRVGMDDACDIFAAGEEFELAVTPSVTNSLTTGPIMCTPKMRSVWHLPTLTVPLCLTHCQRAAVCAEAEVPFVFHAFGFELLFGFANPSDFGVGINHERCAAGNRYAVSSGPAMRSGNGNPLLSLALCASIGTRTTSPIARDISGR